MWVQGRLVEAGSKNAVSSREFRVYDAARPDTLLAGFLTNTRGVFRFRVGRAVRQVVIRPVLGGAGVPLALRPLAPPDTLLAVGDLATDPEVALTEVVVQGRRTGTADVQKRSYAAQPLTTAEAPIAGNFIKTLPGVMSKNGTLMVDGRKVPSYYLNGVAASEEVVRNLPLELVDRVELINKPAASARLSSGEAIINIVLKRPASLQLGGNATGQTSLVGRGEAGTASLYIANKKLFVNLLSNTYANRYRDENQSAWLATATGQPLFSEDGRSRYAVVPSFNSLMVQYKPTARVGVTLGAYQNGKAVRYQNATTLTQAGASYETATESDTHDNQRIGLAEVAYRQNDSTAFILDVGATRLRRQLDLRNAYGAARPAGYAASDVAQATTSTSYSAQLRHTRTVRRAKLELGGLYNTYQYGSAYRNQLYRNAAGQDPAGTLADASRYEVRLGALFATATFALGAGEMHLGYRGEANRLQTTGGLENIDRTIWYGVPTVSYSRPTEKVGVWIASYSRDITLPDAAMVSAGPLSYRPNLVRIGNAGLVPETSHNVELYNVFSNDKRDLTTSIYYNHQQHVIDLYGYELLADNSLSASYANVGALTKFGLNISFTQRLADKVNLNANARFEGYRYAFAYEGSHGNSYQQQQAGTVVEVGAETSYSPTKNLSATLNLTYVNYRYRPFSEELQRAPNVSLSVNKSVLKQKLFLAASWTSLFNLGQRTVVSYFSTDVGGRSTEFSRLQNLTLAATYRFGKKGAEVVTRSEPVAPRRIK
ncbi:hypothetical protein GCM10027422_37370 [Hymenobacter arcticus]